MLVNIYVNTIGLAFRPGKRLAAVTSKTEEFTKRLSRNKNEESNSRCRVMEGFLGGYAWAGPQRVRMYL